MRTLWLVLLTAQVCGVSTLPASGEMLTSCQQVLVSWYGDEFAGRLTASGLVYDPNMPTVAHRTLPFGTRLRMRCNDNEALGLVADRGPFIEGRDLDVSVNLADRLGFLTDGLATCEVCVVSQYYRVRITP